MSLTVGWLAGQNRRSRIGYSAIAFGAWDIFYYVFLKILTPWPHSLLDWDVLFLIPLPWWGPVLAPVLISLLMIGWGTLASRSPSGFNGSMRAWCLNALGMALALFVFMRDSIHSVATHSTPLQDLLPARFHWPLFGMALAMMAAPLIHELIQLVSAPRNNCELNSTSHDLEDQPTSNS